MKGYLERSGVTEYLFIFIFLFGCMCVCVCVCVKGGSRPSRGGGGARGARGRHRNDFLPITFIVHNQKSNGGGGGQWGPMV